MTQYVAFLRGVNVGGHAIVSMAAIKQLFIALGYTDVITLLNSGNVLFHSSETRTSTLITTIETELKHAFKRDIRIIVRTKQQLDALVQSDPFRDIMITAQTRLYLTFLSEKPTSTLPLPYQSPEKDFEILGASKTEVWSVITLSPSRNTTDAMKILEKEFGKNVTTRNWNTVLKIHKKMQP